jgi:tetratricopeptide (TPR) repeat protein
LPRRIRPLQKRGLAISEKDHLASLIPAWIEATQEGKIPTGLEVDEALERALELRDRLRGTASIASFPIDAESVETFHALCTLLDQPGSDPKVLLADTSAAFEFISTLDWPSDAFGGRDDLLSRLAFLCWRYARQTAAPSAESQWAKAHSSINRSRAFDPGEMIFAIPSFQRTEMVPQLRLEDPERLLRVCDLLRERLESAPLIVMEEAVFFHDFIKTPHRQIGISDEREYYLGEFALIAGVACRLLSLREEARRWFDNAETYFVVLHESRAHMARLAYQRLALRLEERDFGAVSHLAPLLIGSFTVLELPEDALKCRFLQAVALKETGRFDEAKEVFFQIASEARQLKEDRLLALAAQNLFQVHAFLGEVDEAIGQAEEAAEIFTRLDSRVHLAKVQLGVGYLLRKQHRLAESIEAFRKAQRQFAEIQMSADVAATHLVVADLLLDAGDAAQAEREIHAALPVIDDLKLMPEGIAALSLLRESLHRRQIDRHALRELEGNFSKKPMN